ncbi:hypothetical protein VULLAG_LOCUS5871 [Vulpes lagopus]
MGWSQTVQCPKGCNSHFKPWGQDAGKCSQYIKLVQLNCNQYLTGGSKVTVQQQPWLECYIRFGKGEQHSFLLYILPYLYYILFPPKKQKQQQQQNNSWSITEELSSMQVIVKD